MRHDDIASPGRQRLGCIALIYAAVMLYSSTIIGPAGMHFVPRDPIETFRSFLITPYVVHGSDQRADWIGNLMMLVPYGFLVAGAIWPRRAVWRIPAMLLALSLCVLTVLSIKYLQLFFPPRTVTLNYIMAQSAGAAIGCACWAIWQAAIGGRSRRHDPVWMLVLALRIYAAALFIFVLMPLDFALDSHDLHLQLARLPDTLLVLPGNGRPPAVRFILLIVATAAFIPVGVLLAFVKNGVYRARRGYLGVAGLGLGITTGLYLLTAALISGYPVLPSVLYRTAGILVGAAAIKSLSRQDPRRLREDLRRLVPWLALPYLFGVLLVNRLLSAHWLSIPQAIEQAYPLGFLPLFDYYIVTKAEAAKNVIGHAVLYAPVGAMLWLRYGKPNRAFALAGALSFGVEAGRYLRPGLQGDINAICVAGVSAMAVARLMPAAWSMIEALGRHSVEPPARTWQRRGRAEAAADLPQPLGEVEEF